MQALAIAVAAAFIFGLSIGAAGMRHWDANTINQLEAAIHESNSRGEAALVLAKERAAQITTAQVGKDAELDLIKTQNDLINNDLNRKLYDAVRLRSGDKACRQDRVSKALPDTRGNGILESGAKQEAARPEQDNARVLSDKVNEGDKRDLECHKMILKFEQFRMLSEAVND